MKSTPVPIPPPARMPCTLGNYVAAQASMISDLKRLVRLLRNPRG